MDSSGLWSAFLLKLSLVGVEVGLMCKEAAGEGGGGVGVEKGVGVGVLSLATNGWGGVQWSV